MERAEGFDYELTSARVYRGDARLLRETAREAAVERKRDVPLAEILHEALADLRLKAKEAGR